MEAAGRSRASLYLRRRPCSSHFRLCFAGRLQVRSTVFLSYSRPFRLPLALISFRLIPHGSRLFRGNPRHFRSDSRHSPLWFPIRCNFNSAGEPYPPNLFFPTLFPFPVVFRLTRRQIRAPGPEVPHPLKLPFFVPFSPPTLIDAIDPFINGRSSFLLTRPNGLLTSTFQVTASSEGRPQTTT